MTQSNESNTHSGTMWERCKNNVKKQLQQIKTLPQNVKAKSCVLVLDTITAPILSDLISMPQLVEIGIKNLYRVDKIRKPQPASIAIYYISCNSLKFLYKDFEKFEEDNSKKSKKKQKHEETPPLYFSINLLLCEQVSKDTLKQISQQQAIIERIASFGQLYIPCRYTCSNIGILPFSRIATQKIQILRKLTKQGLTTSRISYQGSKKLQQQKQSIQNIKHTLSAYQTHSDTLSCLSEINFYQHAHNDKKQNNSIKKLQQTLENLAIYGRKLSESIIAGINIGQSTLVKMIYYQSKFCCKLKQSFKKNFKEFLLPKNGSNENISGESNSNIFVDNNNDPQAKEVIIILVDRFIDNLSPLVRSYLYSPLLMDIFKIKDPPSSSIKIVSKKIAPTVIENSDEIFQKYKNTNIFQVFAKIDDDFKEFLATNKAVKFQKQQKSQKAISCINTSQIQMHSISQTKSAIEIRQVLKQMPQYKKKSTSYNININVLGIIASLKNQFKLDDQTDLQHMIITGYNKDNNIEKDKKILQKLNTFLSDPGINQIDRCRLYVLAACFLDITNEQRNKIIKKLSQIQKYGDIAMGLTKLMNKQIKKYPVSSHSIKNPKLSYIDKHQCILSNFIQELSTSTNISSKITKLFTSEQLKSPSLKKKSLTKDINRQKTTEYVVCMCGGMGYNQIADIERMIKNNGKSNIKINFITDYIFTPQQYLEQLCSMIS